MNKLYLYFFLKYKYEKTLNDMILIIKIKKGSVMNINKKDSY